MLDADRLEIDPLSTGGTGTINFNQTDTLTLAADIVQGFSGTFIVNQRGTGTTILTGTNTYSGDTTVTGGTLQGSTTSLPGDIVNDARVVFDQGSDGTYAGTMTGTGELAKQGSGVLTLTGTNTYTGGTTVSDGTLQGNTTSLQGDITNNATVVFNQGSVGTYAGTMTGSGTLDKQGAGALTLTGSNTYTGGTTISGGTLLVNGSIHNSRVVVAGGTLGGSGTLGDVETNSGTVAPGNSIGTLTVAGDWSLASGARYLVELITGGTTAGTHNDLVEVGGKAPLKMVPCCM